MLAAMLAVTAACTADDPTPGRPTGSANPQCDGRLDAAFGAWARAGFSGAVAVSTGGRFESLAGYGAADDATGARNTADTVYYIGSVTKTFTATAILKLAEGGKPTGTGPDVTLDFAGGNATVAAPAGTTTARRPG